jgi:chemotaxis protein CheD
MNAFDREHMFFDRIHGRLVQRILPGEFLAMNSHSGHSRGTSNEPSPDVGMMMTVLGSCVAVCLTDVESNTAGMNHFMLPEAVQNFDPMNANARYGVHAMELLINQMMRLGAQRHRMRAWVFGGARVLTGLSDIGKCNIDFALKYLYTEKITVSAQTTGGTLPRKLYLDPIVCIPTCIPIAKITPKFDRDEQSYAHRLAHPQPSGSADVSIFTESAL